MLSLACGALLLDCGRALEHLDALGFLMLAPDSEDAMTAEQLIAEIENSARKSR